uniref:Putative carbohydrate sulfotransferase 3-like protein n=1 Tax=Ixodes scapularis TaxID=6945 RepID=A0A4D5RKK9_IXOSC
MVRRKNVLLLLFGAAVFLAVIQLAPDRKLSTVRAPVPASPSQDSVRKVPQAVTTTGSSKVSNESKPKTYARVASVQPDAAKNSTTTSTTSRKPSYATVNFRAVGVVTSTSISIVRAPVIEKKPQKPQTPAKPKGSHLKPLLLNRMLKMFELALKHYAVVPANKVQRVIIVTYFRAGSTFVGDIFSSNPRTFYHFEPLHMFSKDARLNGGAAQNASKLVGHLLRCEFNRVQHYIRWVSEAKFLFRRNHFLWAMCGGQNAVCFKGEYVAKVCLRAPTQVMKVTRLHMSQVHDWIKANRDIAGSVKVVHLVRDPRGILASRRLLDWCNESKSCAHQDTLCSEIRADLDSFQDLKREFPNGTYRLRYEDVSMEPEREVIALFKELGIKYTTSVGNFLKTHTKARKADVMDPYSTRRNSSTVAFEWRQKLKYADIVEIQRSCADVLLRLGYKAISSASELNGEPPIRSIPNLVATGVRSTLRVSEDKTS